MNGKLKSVGNTPITQGIWGWRRSVLALGILVGMGSAGDLVGFAGTWKAESSNQVVIGQAISNYGLKLDSISRVSIQGRLLETNHPARQLTILVLDSGRKAAIGYEDRPGVPASIDGSPLTLIDAGESLQMRLALTGGDLVESFQAEDGKRTNKYSLSPDGKAMSMEVKVESPYMPEPLSYRVGFSRK